MNLYIFLLLLTLVFIAGYISGFMFMAYSYADAKNADHKKKSKKMESVSEENSGEENAGEFEEVHNSLASRFTDKGNSFTDLVCGTEDVDSQEYVEKKRKHQTEAYNYASIKKKEC